MRFTVPQFIEHEAKIIGPLTFRQFIFIGIAGTICFFLYFSVAKTNFFLFLILSIFIFGIGAALAFLKIGGQSLPTILVNFFRFSLSPKLYIWNRKETLITVVKKVEIKKEAKEKEEGFPLKIAKDSRLKKIKNEIETKIR